MIYLVSGMYRSGTSAMMEALIAGGMEAAWSEERNKVAQAHSDLLYHPNPSGLYEIPLKEYSGVKFPLAYQGKLIKVMLWGLDGLAVNPEGYKVIILRRDPEEIRQSYEAFFGKKCPPLLEYQERIQRAESMLRNRLDVRGVCTVDYSHLCKDPVFVFEHLNRVRDWPVDTVKSAAKIDPNKYRFRLERLIPGL